jgi:hypothetical protein
VRRGHVAEDGFDKLADANLRAREMKGDGIALSVIEGALGKVIACEQRTDGETEG